MNIVIERSSPSVDELINLYVSVGWGKRKYYLEDKIKLLIKETSAFYLAQVEKSTVGFGRVLSDNTYCTYITEIVVNPSFQANHIGSKIIQRINEDFRHTAIYLDALEGQESFFEKNGYKKARKLTAMSKGSHRFAHNSI